MAPSTDFHTMSEWKIVYDLTYVVPQQLIVLQDLLPEGFHPETMEPNTNTIWTEEEKKIVQEWIELKSWQQKATAYFASLSPAIQEAAKEAADAIEKRFTNPYCH